MSPKTDEPTPRRHYDARSRRKRAEAERRHTRERVLDAAWRKFLADGYRATKMTDIAAEAGVAIASVYRAGRSKADLIALIFDRDSAGGESREASAVSQARPHYPDIANEPDPRQQIAMIADRVSAVLERDAPLWTVLRDAASADPRAAETMTTLLARRATSFDVAIGLLPADQLRMSADESADTLWALSSPETYNLLRSIRGWDHAHFRDWLRRVLTVQLLIPAGDPVA